MTLVEIRCKTRGCGRRLGAVDEVPTDWSGQLSVPACRQHGQPRDWSRRFTNAPPAVEHHLVIQLATLRPAVELALRSGRAVAYPV